MKKTPFLLNLFYRLTGEWPLSGPPPLTEQQHSALFDSNPSFVDYFPIVDYLEEDQCYLFDDFTNVAKAYEVKTRYMAAKTEEALDGFNESVTRALNALPTNDESSYVAQIYVIKQNTNNIGDQLAKGIRDKESPFVKKMIEITQEQSDLLTHEKGAFPDSRLENKRGWRVGEQKTILFIYQQRSKSFWKKNKKTPANQLKSDLVSFDSAMQSAGMSLNPLLPCELVNWLSPLFGNHKKWNENELKKARALANWDLGQIIFDIAPKYHQSEEKTENGIFQFGSKYSRYLTLGGVHQCPRSGAVTLGNQRTDGSKAILDASFFEKLPEGSMFSYIIVPQTDAQIKHEMTLVANQADDTASRKSDYASEQADNAYEEMMRNHQKIFYCQLGIYLTANSLEELLDNTETAISEVGATSMIKVVDPQWDLFPTNSYIRSLPGVYSFKKDRNGSLRARKTYTAHLASLLPFFGNKSGSNHPCYIMYTRSGQPFFMNPFHSEDKVRVSHEVFLGPTGSGKSATICYMTAMSAAVNNPRTFLFDYGGSFKLLADFFESMGKKVKRIKFSANSKDVIAPFFETKKALKEVEKSELINQGKFVEKDSDNDADDADDEERTYLGEMEAILIVMVTGGSDEARKQLTQTDLSQISNALARGLKLSVKENEPHARPKHMAEAMQAMADEESAREGGIESIATSMYNKASAIRRWTQGQHGILFNRTAEGFDPNYDLTLIEIGNLSKSPDMMAVAGLSCIYNITAMAEQLQSSGRSIEVKIDEAHLWAKVGMLMDGLIVGAKVFRKLNTWLCVITQDVSDFKGDAIKILTNAEFWWLMRMSEKEIKSAIEVLKLDEEVQHLIKFPMKEKGRFVEGVSISEKFPDTLIRYIPPSLILALAQTEGDEKNHRQQLMKAHNCSELEAAYLVAEEITASRKSYQIAESTT